MTEGYEQRQVKDVDALGPALAMTHHYSVLARNRTVAMLQEMSI